MSEIYTVIVGILGILAISGLFVGVTNDAVNFLNSAIGSKAAPMRTILLVASIGIIIGVVTSSGMMEVARSGMFNPGLFTFHEVMMLYLGVMFANIILLDLYNSWGLPACSDRPSPCRSTKSRTPPTSASARWDSSSTPPAPWASSRRSSCRWSSPSPAEPSSCTSRARSSRSATRFRSAASGRCGAAPR